MMLAVASRSGSRIHSSLVRTDALTRHAFLHRLDTNYTQIRLAKVWAACEPKQRSPPLRALHQPRPFLHPSHLTPPSLPFSSQILAKDDPSLLSRSSKRIMNKKAPLSTKLNYLKPLLDRITFVFNFCMLLLLTSSLHFEPKAYYLSIYIIINI